MSEELTKLIDKTIGKKGRLRVPAYWMHKVLSGIVGYVKEQAEKVKTELNARINRIITTIEDLTIVQHIAISSASASASIEYPANKLYFAPFVIKNIRILRKEGLFTIYAFLDSDSRITVYDSQFGGTNTYDLPVQEDSSRIFGLYKIDIRAIDTFVFSTLKLIPCFFCAVRIDYKRSHYDKDKLAVLSYSGRGQTSAFYYDGKRIADYENYETPNNLSNFTIMFIGQLSHFSFRECFVKSVEFAESKTNYIISDYQFKDNKTLESFDFKYITNIGDESFSGCDALTNIELQKASSIGDSAFYGCTALSYIIIRRTTPPMVGSKAFYDTNSCPIYVPDESVDTYKNGIAWAIYSDRIKPLSELTE